MPAPVGGYNVCIIEQVFGLDINIYRAQSLNLGFGSTFATRCKFLGALPKF